jgi:uncharacterized protein YcfJ
MSSRISSGLLVMGLVLAMPAIGEDYYGNSGYDYADVINVDPLYRDVRVSVPRQECRVEVHEEPGGTYYRQGVRPNPASTIIGGLIGAVVGHQLGRGGGRDAATVAGAVMGAAVGHDVARRRGASSATEAVYVPSRRDEREVCRMRYEERLERQIDGYLVTYRYNGRIHHTQMAYDPGTRIRVRVSVDPMDG